jgi:hypothetical protein
MPAAVLYKQALDAGSKHATKTITKHGAGLAERVRFKKGGVRKDKETPPQFRGPCCGGTREVGMGKKAKCVCCGKYEMYVCQDCRRPLALTDEQRERASMVKSAHGRSRATRWLTAALLATGRDPLPQGRRRAARAARAAAHWCLAELANHPTASFHHTGALTRTWTMRSPRR